MNFHCSSASVFPLSSIYTRALSKKGRRLKGTVALTGRCVQASQVDDGNTSAGEGLSLRVKEALVGKRRSMPPAVLERAFLSSLPSKLAFPEYQNLRSFQKPHFLCW